MPDFDCNGKQKQLCLYHWELYVGHEIDLLAR